DGSIKDNTWTVALKAREQALAKAIGSITLEGGSYVKNITITEANGDRTNIIFSAMQSGEGAMNADEVGLF
ncbi:MAG: outer membrane lipoprotein carrier protein LolA, partial [Burkholderiaceae bacterium]